MTTASIAPGLPSIVGSGPSGPCPPSCSIFPLFSAGYSYEFSFTPNRTLVAIASFSSCSFACLPVLSYVPSFLSLRFFVPCYWKLFRWLKTSSWTVTFSKPKVTHFRVFILLFRFSFSFPHVAFRRSLLAIIPLFGEPFIEFPDPDIIRF